MTTIAPDSQRSTQQAPAAPSVHDKLKRHILADGLPIVLDLEKSHGAYLHDAQAGRDLLDLFCCFSTCPLGYNHPRLDDPEFRERILPAALNKPSNSDLYTELMADFVEALARTVPASLNQHMFFIEGGALAVGERPQDGLRLEGAEEPRPRHAGQGHADPALS